jgi:microcystin-dependent protein
MAEPFIAEIRMFSFGFAPKGWATCDGQLMAIAQNQALFALLGVMYGGNGTSNFNLPDLRGRIPIHIASGYPQGTASGTETVQLTLSQIPPHTHGLQATTNTTTVNVPVGNAFANSPSAYPIYSDVANLVTMNAATIASEGGGGGHVNIQPFLVINFCIALSGYFPSRN